MERAGVQIVALGASSTSTSTTTSRIVSSGGRSLLVTSNLLVSLYSRDLFNGSLAVVV